MILFKVRMPTLDCSAAGTVLSRQIVPYPKGIITKEYYERPWRLPEIWNICI
jgi:hypothetical protein